jgi:EmrB/QacA subfamily drug resistance transporter
VARIRFPEGGFATSAAVTIDPADTTRRRKAASKWTVFAIVGTALFMASLDLTIIGTALPAIHESLHAAINWTAWSVTAFTLGTLVIMPIAGGISDQFGRKRVFVASAVVFTASSLCCGLAGNIYILVALRALQALGGGAFMPSATGIVADSFGPNRDRAIAMFTSILPAAGIIGPVLGGFFVTYWSWRGIFFVNVPIGIVVTAAAIRYLPRSAPKDVGRADLAGIALLGTLVLSAMFGVSTLGESGTTAVSPQFLAPVLFAFALGVVFWRHLHRSANPIIPLDLLRKKAFLVMDVVNLVYGAAVLGVGALVPLYAEDRFHLHPVQAGTVLTARAVGTIAIAGVTSFLLRRTGFRIPMAVGFAFIVVGSALTFMAPRGMGPFGWLSIATGITGLGMGAAMPAANNATLSISTDNIAAITGMRGMFRSAGSIVSVSVMTALVARSAHPGITLGWGYLIIGFVALATVPLIFTIDDHRGRW